VKLPTLHCWRDSEFRSAAENMALDEALFLWSCRTGNPVARFYHWDHSAVTIGYFGSIAGPRSAAAVRRYTGGGLVEHGEDLTFLLALPAESPPVLAPAMERYRWIHESLARALAVTGVSVALANPGPSASTGPCFANPVPWDLLDPTSGAKIGGGAQRRTKGAVIHQGSLRLPPNLRNPMAPWLDRFLEPLADSTEILDSGVREELLGEATRLKRCRYDDPGWNRSGSAAGSCKESFPRPRDSG
jgi:lipoate-protein ligase A